MMVTNYHFLERKYARMSLSCTTSGYDLDRSVGPMYAINDVIKCPYCRSAQTFDPDTCNCRKCGGPLFEDE